MEKHPGRVIPRLTPLLVLLISCAPSERDEVAQGHDRLVTYTEDREACSDYSVTRQALFGDLHVHTAYSFDAAANSLETYPEHAHRFAKGQAIPFFPLDENGSPVGSIKLDRPLDFVAITDHGEFLGERALCRTPASPRYDTPFCQQYRSSERHHTRRVQSESRRLWCRF